jgi:hypothetical protein
VSDHPSFISITQGMSGHFAVLMSWSEEGFYEPWSTGFGRYPTREEAIREAREWAEAEGLEYKA